MKKFLSILGAITLTGTSIPNVIAASNYEKENIEVDNSTSIQVIENTKSKITPIENQKDMEQISDEKNIFFK